MLLNTFTFHVPQTLDELLKLYSELEKPRLQAGGTFLLNTLKLQKRKGAKTPEHVITLQKIQELKGLESTKDALIIKSMTTIDDVYDSPLLTGCFQVLRTVCRNISTQPIRNMATFGGNLTCRYTWTEMPAVMIALNATMHFTGTDKKSEHIPAEDFYKNAAKTDKIFTHVSIPNDPGAKTAYQRISKTQFVDIPLLSLCVKTTLTNKTWANTRVGINNCVAFAQRDSALEAFLNGKKSSDTLAEEALAHITPDIYDTRSDDYKKYIFRVCLKKAINAITRSS